MSDTEMKIFGFKVQAEMIELQIDMPTGARVAIQFTMDMDDLDAVQDFIDHFEEKVKTHLTEKSWEPSGNGFKPDQKG